MQKIGWRLRQKDRYATKQPALHNLILPEDPTIAGRSEPPTQKQRLTHEIERIRRTPPSAEFRSDIAEAEQIGKKLVNDLKRK